MMSNAKTREELHAEVKARLTPGDHALIDQREAVLRDVSKTFAANRALMLDPRIESWVRHIMREHSQYVPRGADYVSPPQHLRESDIHAGIYSAQVLDTDRPSLTPILRCDYCLEYTGRQDAAFASVPVGAYAVELKFCSACAGHLQKSCPSVRWSQWTDEQCSAEIERRRSDGSM